jgi:glucosamine--fructose-6-phosphate aminotransferase (isomerizing)
VLGSSDKTREVLAVGGCDDVIRNLDESIERPSSPGERFDPPESRAWRARSAPALSRMIERQAATIRRLAELDLGPSAATVAAARTVVLVGTGTSHHAAELGAMLLGAAGCHARAVSAAHYARWQPPAGPEDALVVISHTATTAFSVRARLEALQAGVPVVSITGIGGGWPEAIETVEPEASETYTVSYTAALTVLAKLAYELGAGIGSPSELLAVADQVERICVDPGIGHVAVPARALAIIGAGPWAITAREGALKLREGARILAEGFEAENYLHGHAVPHAACDTLVALQPSGDPDGLVGALVTAAEAAGLATAVLEADGPETSPLVAQIPMTVRLQLLAGRFAAWRGTDPDVAIVGPWAEPGLWVIGRPDPPRPAS